MAASPPQRFPHPLVRLRLQRYNIEKPISSILWVVSWGVLA